MASSTKESCWYSSTTLPEEVILVSKLICCCCLALLCRASADNSICSICNFVSTCGPCTVPLHIAWTKTHVDSRYRTGHDTLNNSTSWSMVGQCVTSLQTTGSSCCADGPGFMQETISTRRDKADNTACAECGNPNNLKLCSGEPCHFYISNGNV